MESFIAVAGRCFTICFAVAADGTRPAEEFLTSLEQTSSGKRDLAGVYHLLRLFAEVGRISNPTQFKQLRGTEPTLLEFKKRQVRVLGFFDGESRICLTHGFVKKQNKTPPTEIERAIRIQGEHQARRGSKR